MTNKCSCGLRDKTKCSKENGLEGGKMCLKEEIVINEHTPTEFERRLGELHLQLYHLMLDAETTWCEASACNHVLKAFEEAWDKLKEATE